MPSTIMSTITSGISFSAQTDASIPDYVYLNTTDEGIFSSHNDAKVSLFKTQPRLKENNK